MSLTDSASELHSAYLKALGLTANPFPVVPDTINFYQPERINALLTEILHVIHQRKGFVLITGEVGLGKTTISRQLLKLLEQQNVQSALIINTFLQGNELLEEINKDFGLKVTGGLKSQLSALNDYLMQKYQDNINCTLIIDDAQHLNRDSLELIRQISNLETDSAKLIQILLVGQPELQDKLDTHELRQLKSRIALQVKVKEYDLDELKQYVYYKLNCAGDQGQLKINTRAFNTLLKITQGNPRKINLLMGRCLYASVAYETNEITHALISEMADELGLIEKKEKAFLFSAGSLYSVLFISLLVIGAYSFVNSNSIIMPFGRDILEKNRQNEQASPETNQPAVDVATITPSDQSEAQKTAAIVVEQQAEPLTEGSPHRSVPETVPVPADIVEFMRHYELEKYSEAFYQAQQQGWLDNIKNQIFLDTGFRLVKLKKVTPAIHKRYALLKFTGKTEGKDYLLFWKPDYWVKQFYLNYKSPEIRTLQKSLQDLGVYHGNLDGIVGNISMQGILDFQALMGLDKTGIADTPTQFYLQQPFITFSWYLRLGLFTHRANAKNLEKLLIDRKLTPVIIDTMYNDKKMYSVEIGPLKTRKDANQIKKHLPETMTKNAFIHRLILEQLKPDNSST